jgi:GNAT superfamily N-acetyltransferase
MSRAWEHGFFRARIAHPVDIVIWQSPGVDVGAVYLEERSADTWIESLEVMPTHQGHGAGSAMLTWLLQRAQMTGRPVRLHVHKANTGARQLYERSGFVLTGETATHDELSSP